jgi:hypothetical protein
MANNNSSKDDQKKILIFGVGSSGRAAFRKLNQVNENKIIGFIDNSFFANEKIFFNKIVSPPIQITSIDFDLIVISGRDINEIQDQLLNDLKIPMDKILLLSRSDLAIPGYVKNNKERAIINILKKLTNEMSANNIDYWMDYSALLALHRNEDLSDFSDVDIAINSLDSANTIFEIMSKQKENYNIYKTLIKQTLNYANVGDIKQICIQSNVDLEKEEPAIIDIHVKFFHENKYKSPSGKFTFFTPSSCFDGYEVIAYKDILLNIPLNSQEYLELIYGKNWKIPAENWRAGDYGNILDE